MCRVVFPILNTSFVFVLDVTSSSDDLRLYKRRPQLWPSDDPIHRWISFSHGCKSAQKWSLRLEKESPALVNDVVVWILCSDTHSNASKDIVLQLTAVFCSRSTQRKSHTCCLHVGHYCVSKNRPWHQIWACALRLSGNHEKVCLRMTTFPLLTSM